MHEKVYLDGGLRCTAYFEQRRILQAFGTVRCFEKVFGKKNRIAYVGG